MVIKKRPNQKDRFGVSWTKWFMPSLYFTELYRNRFPHTKPSPEKLKKYGKINMAISVFWVMFGWTALGYVFFNTDETQKYQYDKNDPRSKRIAEIAGYQTKDSIYSDKRIKMATIGWKGIEMHDVTDEVKEIVLEGKPDKYKDPDYLAVRANMSKDDPRFDVEFWGAYFKKIDNRPTLNDKISGLLK